MAYINYHLPFIFSSSAASGATNINAGGNRYEILLERPLVIPRHAVNVFLTTDAASVWWNIYNIVFNVNDQIDVEYFDGFITVNVTLTLEPGLYDLDHLTSEVGRELLAAGLPQDLFIYTPDQASNKTVIQFNYSGVQLDMRSTVTRNYAQLIGFDERLVPLAGQTTGVQFERSDSIAALNSVDHFLIHSDLVSRGLRVNDQYQNVISQVLIDQPPGSQILSRPFNPPQIPCQELAGESRKSISVFITDQDNGELDLNGEIFTCRVVIHYTLKLEE
jgi:hypothetical protein